MSDAHEREEREGEPAHGPAIGGGAAAFAAVVTRRALRRGVRRTPLARVLRRAVRAMPRRAAPPGVTFAPVLRFTIVAGQREEASGRIAAHPRDARVPSVARVLTAPPPAFREPLAPSALAGSATVARAVARGSRSHGDASGVTARARTGTTVPAREHFASRTAHPVARVLRTQAPMTDATIEREAVRSVPGRPSRATVPPTLSALEVSRLTEHVLRTMDRRISAFRERQGRS